MPSDERFHSVHADVTRRDFVRAGLAGLVVSAASGNVDVAAPAERDRKAVDLEPYFTPQDSFRDVSRGKPLPHSLPDEKKREVGLTRDTWRLEVLSDPEHPATMGRQLTRSDGTAIDFAGLLRLGEKHAVRFAKVMTCLNIGCPLGMGVWEGVPLREIVWLTAPKANLRRVFYHGYHNDDPKQVFRSSLPAGRVLEDPADMPPVIVCYKLNGEWLTSERGGPVRIVVPEAYGFKSVKWLSHVYLTNLYHANDTYAGGNNDVDSPLKTFAATLHVPNEVKAGEPITVTGYAQVGVSGLSKVQVWVAPAAQKWPADDPYFTKAPWIDAAILPPPGPSDSVPLRETMARGVAGFVSATARPRSWPQPLTKAHWSVKLPGLPAGRYTLRSRSVDARGLAQPMPRPFRKSGWCDIEAVQLTIDA